MLTLCRKNGIKHTLTPPYHPSTNGAAERSVQIVKHALLKQVLEGKKVTMKKRLANFLFMYRITPQSTTGRSPSELFLKRNLRSRFSIIQPCLNKEVEAKQEKQCFDKGTSGKLRTFNVGDRVRVRNIRGGKTKWIIGTVVKVRGPLTYIIRIGDSRRFVHVDHLIAAEPSAQDITHEPDSSDELVFPNDIQNDNNIDVSLNVPVTNVASNDKVVNTPLKECDVSKPVVKTPVKQFDASKSVKTPVGICGATSVLRRNPSRVLKGVPKEKLNL